MEMPDNLFSPLGFYVNAFLFRLWSSAYLYDPTIFFCSNEEANTNKK